MTTLKDIALLAGVSPMTVSRVINGLTVKGENRAKVEQAMEDLNFVPNLVARSFRSGRTETIGLIIPSIIAPFFTHLARGVEDAINRAGYKLMLCTHSENIERESQYINTLIASRVDGLIITPADEASKPALELLQANDIPFVSVDRIITGIESDYIVGDSFESARSLTEYLLNRGHERIAVITGPHSLYTSGERYRGFQSAMVSRSRPISPELIRTITHDADLDSFLLQIKAAISDFLALPNPPTALFAYSELVAIQALNVLDALGLRYPDDLDIVCFEDVAPLGGLKPRIPAAVQPVLEMGHLAFDILMQRIEEPDRPYKSVVLKPEYKFSSDPKSRTARDELGVSIH